MSYVSTKTLVRTGMVAMAAGATAVALSAPALAAIPHVKVTPHTNLTNKQMVKVSVTHFPANTAVTIYECNDNGDGDLANCNQGGSKAAKTDGTGTIKNVAFKVVTGAVGSTGTCGTSSGDKFCYLAVIASTQMQATTISFKV